MSHYPPDLENDIEVVTGFRTSDGEIFHSKDVALFRAMQLRRVKLANEMLNEGKSIGEILDEVDGTVIDGILYKITKDTKLVIEHWQCKDNPGYQIHMIDRHMRYHARGDVGSWSGLYGSSITIHELVRYARHKKTVFA